MPPLSVPTASQSGVAPALAYNPLAKPVAVPSPAVISTATPAIKPTITSTTTGSASQGLDPQIVNLAKAIRQTESQGNFQAKGASGEYGGYQFLPATWNATAPKYGINVPLNQATPAQQNEVAYKQLAEWKQQNPSWNVGNFASAWNAGPGKPNAYLEGHTGTNSQGVAYDTPGYAAKVAQAYQQIKGQSNPEQAPPTSDTTTPTTQPAQPQGDLLSKASDILNTIFPNKNIGELLGTELAKATVPADQRQYVAPSKATVGGIGGDLLGDAAWLVGGGEAAPAIKEAATGGRLIPAALQGAKAGALSGTLGGAGNALSNGGNLVQAGQGAVTGGALGGITGGILGGATAALPGIVGRISNGGIQSEDNIVAGLNRTDPTVADGLTKLDKNAAQSEAVAGSILQGDKAGQSVGAQVLNTIDTSKVKTYDDLSRVLQSEADKELSTVNKEHAANPTPTKLADLNQKVDSGIAGSKLSLKVNYVKDALDQLNQFYTKTNDIQSAARIRALTSKARTTGLTSTEINNLAKEHGRALNGYNANGELASGLSKQAAENTRKGLKTTARSFLSSDAAKQADKRASDILNVKSQVDTVAEKVNSLAQKVEQRNIFQKVLGGAGKSVAQGINVVSGGAPKAFFQKLFLESNLGNKTGNYLDFEERLQRNLKILSRLNGSTDTQVENFLRSVIGGLVQKR